MLLPAAHAGQTGPHPARDSGPQPVFPRGYTAPGGPRASTPLPAVGAHRDGFGEFDDIDEEYLELMGLGRRRRWLRTFGLLALLLVLLAALGFLFVRSHGGDLDSLVQRLMGSDPDPIAGTHPGGQPRPAGPQVAARATASPAHAGQVGTSAGSGEVVGPPVAPPGPAPAGDTSGAAAGQAKEPAAEPTPGEATGASPAGPTASDEPAAAGAPPAQPAVAEGTGRGADPPPAQPPAQPVSAERLLRKARNHLLRGRAKKALVTYEALLKRRPRSPEALTGLGWCHINLGRPHIAVLKFREALKVSPRFGEALIGLGKAYRLQNKREAARAVYARYLKEHPAGSKASSARAALERLGATP